MGRVEGGEERASVRERSWLFVYIRVRLHAHVHVHVHCWTSRTLLLTVSHCLSPFRRPALPQPLHAFREYEETPWSSKKRVCRLPPVRERVVCYYFAGVETDVEHVYRCLCLCAGAGAGVGVGVVWV